MLNYKKLFAKLLLANIFTITMFSCANKKNNEMVNLIIWDYYSNSQQVAFANKVDEFNNTVGKEKNIYVEQVAFSTSELENKLFSSANNEPGADAFPDAFFAYNDTTYALDKLGKVASLDSYFSKEDLDKFEQKFLPQSYLPDGKLKIIPIAKSTEALYINKTYFDKFVDDNKNLNISLNDLSTIEGIIRVSEAYYNYAHKAFYGRDSLSNYFVISAKQLGFEIFDYDNNGNFYVNFDKNLYKQIFNNYFVPYIKGYFTSSGRFRSSDLQAGNIICYTGSTSSGGFFPKQVIVSDNQKDDIEAYVIPAPIFTNTKGKYAVSQGAGMVVTKSTKEKEQASSEFIKWFTKANTNQEFALSTGYMPVIKDTLNEEFINKSTGTNKKTYEVCKDIIDNYILYANKSSLYSSSIRSIFDNELDELAKNALEVIDSKPESEKENTINYYLSNGYFEEWFASFKQKIENVYLG